MSLPTRTILIIDDNPDDIEFYKQLLERASGEYSYNVLTAESAQEGLEIFKENSIDCTFIDFNMPGEDGLKGISLLQKQTARKQIPMVILTGEPHQHVKAEAARNGALDYIVKDAVNSSETLEKIINKVVLWTDAINKEEALPNA